MGKSKRNKPSTREKFAADPNKSDEEIVRESIHLLFPGEVNFEELLEKILTNSTETRRYEKMQRDEVGPPRPQNVFILYRRIKSGTSKFKNRPAEDNRASDVSPEIATLWHSEPHETKNAYYALYRLVVKRHKEIYGEDYKYIRKSKSKTGDKELSPSHSFPVESLTHNPFIPQFQQDNNSQDFTSNLRSDNESQFPADSFEPAGSMIGFCSIPGQYFYDGQNLSPNVNGPERFELANIHQYNSLGLTGTSQQSDLELAGTQYNVGLYTPQQILALDALQQPYNSSGLDTQYNNNSFNTFQQQQCDLGFGPNIQHNDNGFNTFQQQQCDLGFGPNTQYNDNSFDALQGNSALADNSQQSDLGLVGIDTQDNDNDFTLQQIDPLVQFGDLGSEIDEILNRLFGFEQPIPDDYALIRSQHSKV